MTAWGAITALGVMTVLDFVFEDLLSPMKNRTTPAIVGPEFEARGRRTWTGTSSRASGKNSKAMRGNSGAS
jgi:hypothetical protein